MSYSTFSYSEVKNSFNLTAIEDSRVIPDKVLDLEPSSWLLETLASNVPLAIAIGTEKAKSELIIMPVLVELRKRLKNTISIFSGTEFNVDPNLGLTGICDFLISSSSEQIAVEAPILVLVEAKKADLNIGMGQVVAEMLAAQLFNQQQDMVRGKIYGCITSGTQWRFLSLEGHQLCIELQDYSLHPLPSLLGKLLWILTKNNK